MDKSMCSRPARGRRSLRADHAAGPMFEAHEPRTMMTAAVGLLSNNVLVEFDTDSPADVQRGVVVTGLRAGERLASIDFNPYDGLLYGVATGGVSDGLYRINVESGAARRIADVPGLAGDEATARGIDFDPTTGLLSVLSEFGLGRVVNTASGAAGWMDVNLDAEDAIHEIAFSNNTSRSGSTVLYALDYSYDMLVRIDPDGSVVTVGNLGVTTDRFAGFDIGADGVAYAAMRRAEPGGSATAVFGTINLATGAFTQTGVIGGDESSTVLGLAVRTVRHAPVLAPGPHYRFGGVTEDSAAGRTVLVRDLLASGGPGMITDADPNALRGVAVTGAGFGDGEGAWSYTLDGVSWTGLPLVSAAGALLLPADGLAALRFVPAANQQYAPPPLEFRAWDQSAGVAGRLGNVNGPGLAGSVSVGANAAEVVVTPVYDAPRLTFTGNRRNLQSNAFGRPFSTVAVVSPDGSDVTVRVRVGAPAKGSISAASLDLAGFTPGTKPGEFVLTADAATAQAMLRVLRYVPVVGATGDAPVMVVVGDSTTNDAQTYTLTYALTLNNTAPVISDVPVLVRAGKVAPAAVFGLAQIADADGGQVQTVTVKLGTVAKGDFTAQSLQRAGFTASGAGQYRFVGDASTATAAIRKLRYQFRVGLPAGRVQRLSVMLSVADGLAAPVVKTTSVVRNP